MFRFFSSQSQRRKVIILFSKQTCIPICYLELMMAAQDMETSVELIRGMSRIRHTEKLITTPHIIWDMYRNTPDIINEKLDLLKEAIKKEGIDVEIHAAAEYFLDEHVEELLKKKEPLLTVSGNKVLTEFSMAFPSMNIKDVLFEMAMQGYQPIIAHPERYIYLQQNKEFYPGAERHWLYVPASTYYRWQATTAVR